MSSTSPDPKTLEPGELLEENREFAGIILPQTGSPSANEEPPPAIYPDSTFDTTCKNPFHTDPTNPFHSAENSDLSDTNFIQPKNFR